MNLINIFITAFLTENIVLTKFLGICPFVGTSSKEKSALGMGLAVTFVITMSSIITYLMEKTGLSAVEMVDIYNKKSGMLGVSGISSDARDLGDAVKAGNERAKITEQLYANRVAQTVGSYFVQLGHVDAMVFTGGIGENDAVIREEILKRLEEAMGLQIDYELNASKRAEDIRLSLDNSKTQVWLIPTDEELVIARDTYAFLNV